MACELSAIQAAACVSGIGKEQNKIKLLQLIAQLTCEAAEGGGGGSQTPWTSDIDGGCFNLNNVCKFNGIGIYRALLTQSGTDAPVATVLENTLGGTVVWDRDDVGAYGANLTGGFPDGRTFVFVTGAGDSFIYAWINSDRFVITAAISTNDGALTRSPIEILVYPATPQCPDCA